ncbi:MAG: metalloregulator ArsR/SmtB family transcription factor [Victivallaceae bacterium]
MTESEKPFFDAKAKVLKALGHPTRLFMVEELARGERCVCELVKLVGADFSTVSKHLTLLKNAGIVQDDKRGQMVYYTLKVPCILRFMDCIEAVITREPCK